jgi:phosphorylase kinase alpha/beta subunit
MKNNIISKINDASASLRNSNGLYSASAGEHYVECVWLRDLFMQTLALPHDEYITSWKTFLDYLVLCENKYNKFTNLINEPIHADEFHIRWGVKCNDEYEKIWGHKQFDAWGMALIAIAKEGDILLDNKEYKSVVKFFVESLISQEFWKTKECGAWEENHEIRQSSIACAASGLSDILPYYPELFTLIKNAIDFSTSVIKDFGTNETETRSVDLAQLHGVWLGVPRGIMSISQGSNIISNIESNLIRDYGIIRYKGDEYYNINSRITLDKYNGVFNGQSENTLENNEAEWTLGFPTLIFAYNACHLTPPTCHLKKIEHIAHENNGVIPELYYSGTNISNLNKPLGWACNLFKIVLNDSYKEIF